MPADVRKGRAAVGDGNLRKRIAGSLDVHCVPQAARTWAAKSVQRPARATASEEGDRMATSVLGARRPAVVVMERA
jgi:hypothetical protein